MLAPLLDLPLASPSQHGQGLCCSQPEGLNQCRTQWADTCRSLELASRTTVADLSLVEQGNTELTIVPTTPDLRTVWLNARSLNVISAALRVPTNVPLAFSHLPPAPPTLTNPNDIHTYPELKRAAWRGALEGEEGELGIAIPQGCIVKVPPPDGATPREEAKKEEEWEQIVLVVDYEVVRPGAGIVVVAPDEANPSVSRSSYPRAFRSSLILFVRSASLTSLPLPYPTLLLAPGSLAPITPKIAAPGTSS